MTFSIIEYGSALEAVLKAQRDVSSILTHRGEAGTAREFFVQSVLKRFLPPDVVIGSGEIVDGVGHRSSQQDLLLYRANFPVIDSLAGSHVYLAEGVLATIEVKSTLNPEDMTSATKNIQSVIALTVSPMGLGEFAPVAGSQNELNDLSKDNVAERLMRGQSWIQDQDPLLDPIEDKIFSYIFSFDGPTHTTLMRNAAKLNWFKGEGPDCLCILGKTFGTSPGAPINVPPCHKQGTAFSIENNNSPLGWWLAHLLWAAFNRPFRRPDLRPYLRSPSQNSKNSSMQAGNFGRSRHSTKKPQKQNPSK